jgi:arginyl-tRNA synthetase
MLKVDPVKNMLFNPRESIDFDGNTGPFIQYTYTRIRSVFRKAAEMQVATPGSVKVNIPLNEKEKNLIRLIHEFPTVVSESGNTYNPSLIANFIYDLVREYNQFYHEYSILKEENPDIRDLRLVLSGIVSDVARNGMELLGIEMPERM